MATEERLSHLDSQVSIDAAPLEINPVVEDSVQTPVGMSVEALPHNNASPLQMKKPGGNDVHAEIDREDSNLELPKNESSFLFRSDSCNSFEDGTWLRELEKYKNVMPPEIWIDYYDVLVLYSEDDKHDARKFCDHLKNDINLNDNEFVKAVLYDELVPQAGSKFRLLEIALERCTYIFFYITKEFCEDKKWIEFCTDACLMETIENIEKRWCLVPVNTVPIKTADFRLPFGLRALKGIDYYDSNPYYQAFVSRLIQNKLRERLDKEKKLKEEQFNWLQNYMRTSPFGSKNIRGLENKEKLRTKQQEKQKITEQAVIEGLNRSQPMLLQKTEVQTCTDPQPSSTASERRKSSDKEDHRGKSEESNSQENDPTYNKSIESTDQLSQGGSINHTEPTSHKFSTSGNLSDMPLLDGKDSTVVSSSINSYTGEKRPIQEESPTGTTIDELFCSHSSILDKAMAAEERWSRLDSQVSMDAPPPDIDPVVEESVQTPVGMSVEALPHNDASTLQMKKPGLPDLDAPSLNSSLDWMSMISDQSETRDTSSSPLSQKSRGKADAIKAPMIFNIYHVDNLQLGEKSAIIKSKQTDKKSKNDEVSLRNEADDNDATMGDFAYNKQKDEDSQNPEYLPSGNRSVTELKDQPASVDSLQDSKQSQDCMTLYSQNSQELELSLLKNKAEVEEEKRLLGTKFQDHTRSGKEEGFVPERNKSDRYSHLGARPKDPQKKPVAKVLPIKYVERDSKETSPKTVAGEASDETGIKFVQDILPNLVAEHNATNRAFLFRERQQKALTWYQLTRRPSAPLLAWASPSVPFATIMTQFLRRDVTSSPLGQDPLSQVYGTSLGDELKWSEFALHKPSVLEERRDSHLPTELAERLKVIEKNTKISVWLGTDLTEHKMVFVCLYKGVIQKTIESYKGIDIYYMDSETPSRPLEPPHKMRTDSKTSLSLGDAELFEQAIEEHGVVLFKQHSNLEAITGSSFMLSKSKGYIKCPSIVLYCRVKGIAPIGEGVFPTKLRVGKKSFEVNVDVREGYLRQGMFRQSTWCTKDWHERLRMGISIGVEGVYQGTLGPFVKINDTDIGFLTCAHVIEPDVMNPSALRQSVGRKVFQPADGESHPDHEKSRIDRYCGEVSKIVFDQQICDPINGLPRFVGVDAALVTVKGNRNVDVRSFPFIPDADLKHAGFDPQGPPMFGHGLIRYPLRFEDVQGKRVIKCGKTTCLTKGTLLLNGAMVKIHDAELPLPTTGQIVLMKGQYTVERQGPKHFIEAGDSGAGVFMLDDRNNLTCIGLAIGTLDDWQTVVTPIEYVLKALELRLDAMVFEEDMNIDV